MVVYRRIYALDFDVTPNSGRVVVSMKKQFTIIMIAVFVLAFAGMSARAAGTADNWSLKLTFSTSYNTDLLPVTVGESSAATQLLKPPPLPGFNETGLDADAVVNAYVNTAARKQAAKEIDVKDAAAAGRAWLVKVDVEKAGAVKVKPDMTGFFSGYYATLLDPDNGQRINLNEVASGQDVTAFTATAPGSKTLILLAGQNQTVAVAKGTEVTGFVTTSGVDALPSGVGVYVDGSNTAAGTTDANGKFTVTLGSGVHTIQMRAPMKLSTSGSITVPADGSDGSPVVMTDMYPGDFCCDLNGDYGTGDGVIEGSDFGHFKKAYGKATGQDGYNAAMDFNNDGVIDGTDFAIFKRGYGKTGK